MLDMMEEFEKDRKEEKNFYALINFFKLIIVGRLCQRDSGLFAVLEGNQKLDRLMRDIEEENIALEDHSLGSLYIRMFELATSMENKSQSTILLQARQEFKSIHNSQLVIADYKEWNPLDDIGYASIDLLGVLPIKIAADSKIKSKLLSNEKQKTIGERK